MKVDVQTIKDQLKLTPHPEGGFFKEIYRSNGSINEANLWKGVQGSRNFSTAIYFLLVKNQISAFHKIKQDEMWHFYCGTPLLLHMINNQGDYHLVKIGNNISNGEYFQFVVPSGTWFASEVENKDNFAFCGCTVSPGFDFKDFEMPDRKFLVSKYPHLKEIITRLTHR